MYIKRLIDTTIENELESVGFILITGPKWCGKTRTSMEHCKSKIAIDTKAEQRKIEAVVENNDYSLLQEEPPLLIDEWQVVPSIWDMVRHEVDQRGKRGQFILTGSSVPSNNKTLHSGTGRVSRIRMYPMSLYESGESNGTISLRDLFDGTQKTMCESSMTVNQLSNAIIRGGWPIAVSEGEKTAGGTATRYVNNVVESDLLHMMNTELDRTTLRRIVKSIARNVSMPVNHSLLARESGTDMSDFIAGKIVNAMNEIYFLENLEAWNQHARSRTKLASKPKWEFCDPSLAAAALNVGVDKLFDDYELFGLLFECMCLRDLRAYAQSLDGEISYFKDNADGHEIDFIVELRNGDWGAIEVKMGSAEEDKVAHNLNRLMDKLDPKYVKEPKFKMILTATKYGYKRKDGVLVVPIGCLKD